MRPGYLLLCLPLLSLGSCCTKEDCPTAFYAPSFMGFTEAELDTVRIITARLDGSLPPDTNYSRAVFYGVDRDRASLETTQPFNSSNSYTYYLPATGESYRMDGYEFSYESCNSCFPPAAESKDREVLQAYRLNDVRIEGQDIVIRK